MIRWHLKFFPAFHLLPLLPRLQWSTLEGLRHQGCEEEGWASPVDGHQWQCYLPPTCRWLLTPKNGATCMKYLPNHGEYPKKKTDLLCIEMAEWCHYYQIPYLLKNSKLNVNSILQYHPYIPSQNVYQYMIDKLKTALAICKLPSHSNNKRVSFWSPWKIAHQFLIPTSHVHHSDSCFAHVVDVNTLHRAIVDEFLGEPTTKLSHFKIILAIVSHKLVQTQT